MQWRKWRKIASLWRFELDAKRGPLETGDFGEIGEIGGLAKIARGLATMAIDVPTLWRLAILAKIARGLAISRMWQIFKLDAT